MSDLQHLILARLYERHPGLTQPLADSFAEAAYVCWARHHQPPVTVSLRRDNTEERRVADFPYQMNGPAGRMRMRPTQRK